jgi:hypothetical protein
LTTVIIIIYNVVLVKYDTLINYKYSVWILSLDKRRETLYYSINNYQYLYN